MHDLEFVGVPDLVAHPDEQHQLVLSNEDMAGKIVSLPLDGDGRSALVAGDAVELAFVDIEMGSVSGFDVINELLQISPRTNAVYLTAYPSYALDAWETDACGFMVKPITAEGVEKQLKKLRYPFIPGGSGV